MVMLNGLAALATLKVAPKKGIVVSSPPAPKPAVYQPVKVLARSRAKGDFWLKSGEKEGVFKLPSALRPGDLRGLFVVAAEDGGRHGDHRCATVVCSPDGDRLDEARLSFDRRPCGASARFVEEELVLVTVGVIGADKEATVLIEEIRPQLALGICARVRRRTLYQGKLGNKGKTRPKNVQQYGRAVAAARERAGCTNCTHQHFVRDRQAEDAEKIAFLAKIAK